jgi:hypothetical protein
MFVPVGGLICRKKSITNWTNRNQRWLNTVVSCVHEQNERQGKGENSLMMYQLTIQIEELTDSMQQLKGQVRFSLHYKYIYCSCVNFLS